MTKESLSSGSSVPGELHPTNGEPMNSESSDDMPKEYELRPAGGVRGKYYERYTQGMSIKLVFTSGSSFVASVTSSAPVVGEITKSESYPFNIGSIGAPAHAG